VQTTANDFSSPDAKLDDHESLLSIRQLLLPDDPLEAAISLSALPAHAARHQAHELLLVLEQRLLPLSQIFFAKSSAYLLILCVPNFLMTIISRVCAIANIRNRSFWK
jgi:hypothetical protein